MFQIFAVPAAVIVALGLIAATSPVTREALGPLWPDPVLVAPRFLPSGAGHDAMEFAAIAPIAMLFVRCGEGGISHNPKETLAVEDAEIATSVFLHFLEHFDPRSLR